MSNDLTPTGITKAAEGPNMAFVADCLRNYAALLNSGSVDNAGHYFPSDIYDAAQQIEDAGTPSPSPHVLVTVPCPCTLIEQDEDCPIGYPSLLCGVCKGQGHTTAEQVTALACEMIKIASDVGEPDDPFAAWETVSLFQSQNEQFRRAVEELKFALFSSDMTIKDRADQSARLVLAATATEGSGE